VEDSSSPFPSDYLLQLHVRRFEADYTGSETAPVARVVFDCTLGRRQGREVLANFTVSGEVAAPANHLSQVVAAFEQATGTALNALAQQTAQVVHGDVQRPAQGEDEAPPSGNR
jgi:ABC-type uncharacterized transport system auxiliary subunit